MLIKKKLPCKKSQRDFRKNKPFYKGISLKIFKMSPKKPNSANRNVVRVKLSNKITVNAFVPGEGPRGLFQRSIVLVKRGKTKDLPGVKFKIIRRKFDCLGVSRKSSCSKYGCSKS